MPSARLVLDRIGRFVTFAMPLVLTHGRMLAEIGIDLLAVLLLVRSALSSDWGWSRTLWFRLALVWWLWQAVCSLPVGSLGIGGGPALVQALLAMRFMLFAAALQGWTLRDEAARRTMRWLICICGFYIAAQMLLQAVTGHNLFGVPRFPDGTLTGPYSAPRAAAPLSRLMLPMLLLGAAALDGAIAGRSARLLAMGGMTIGAVGIMVLAGQRMPFALFLLGLGVSAFFFRPMRPAALLAALALPALVMLARIFSPGSFRHLVLLAEAQLSHFGHSAYGAVFTRAIVIFHDNPLTGLGYDAFRHGCARSAYFHGLSWLDAASDGGGAAICVQHAHNHYLQAATNAGWPGLLLFVALVIAWLAALWPRHRPGETAVIHAWRIGLFAAVLMQEWPIASSSDFMNLPLGGWAFLLLGVGLAETAPPVAERPSDLYAQHDASSRI
ncbi:O-antigen ligase family protein [Acidomonas methanolica]|nr:O-antigen ligase family protein [Acidomonas methanolica]MBU2655167.1 O-antigen ligase family protein [Acidomonas methanolica]TCS24694.1 O-antigen ligase-like membrane protein [Acidomonas methanolica]